MTNPTPAQFTAADALAKLETSYTWEELKTARGFIKGTLSFIFGWNVTPVKDASKNLCKVFEKYAEAKNSGVDKAETKKASKAELKAFYKTFKDRVSGFGVDISDEKFVQYAQAAIQMINQTAADASASKKHTFNDYMKDVSKKGFANAFVKCTTEDAVENIETISAESISHVFKSLIAIFPNQTADIERGIRKAASKKHGEEALKAQSQALTAAAGDQNSAIYKAAKAAKEEKLKAEETALKNEKIKLAGNHFKDPIGATHSAWEARVAAEKAMKDAETAKNASRDKVLKEVSGVSSSSTDEDFEKFDGAPSVPEYRENLKKFREAKVAFEAADKAYEELEARRKQVVDVELARINNALADLDVTVRDELRSKAALLTELAFDPSAMNFNQFERAAQLKHIIGY